MQAFSDNQINQEHRYFFKKRNQYMILFDFIEPELLKRILNITLPAKINSFIYIALMLPFSEWFILNVYFQVDLLSFLQLCQLSTLRVVKLFLWGLEFSVHRT